MEKLKEEVLNAFGNKLRVVKNIQRYGIYVCKNNNIDVCIKKLKGKEEDAIFLHNVKSRLKNKNFMNIHTEILTLDKEPYFMFNGDIYICYKNIEGIKFDFTNQVNFLHLIAELGRLHNVLKNTCMEDGKVILNDFENEHKKFVKLKKQINKNSKKNDIDFMVLKEYNKYEDLILKTKKDLLYLDYNDYSSTAINLGDICFNSYDESNFTILDNNIVFNDFSNAKFGVQLQDVSELIYEYIKSCVKADVEPININYIIEAYRRNNELTCRELLILQALLNYPEKYLKNIFKYYNKKRSFVPTETITKLKKYSEIEGIYYDYIGNLQV